MIAVVNQGLPQIAIFLLYLSTCYFLHVPTNSPINLFSTTGGSCEQMSVTYFTGSLMAMDGIILSTYIDHHLIEIRLDLYCSIRMNLLFLLYRVGFLS